MSDAGQPDSSGTPAGSPNTLRAATYLDGIAIKPVYGPEDLGHFDPARELGRAGEYPFTRGIHPHMYRARVWTMRQYIGFGTPAETNARFKYLMARGQDALNVAFDLPTQLGLDSDDARAEGEVGRVGMAVDSLLDMEEAFAGIPADRVSISFTINSMAAFIQAMFLVVADKQGVPWARVVTTPQNDILKEFIARGTWVYPVEPSLRLVCDIAEFCARHAPKVNPISVCGYHIREAGCTPAQEMAYGLLIVAAYADLLVRRGLDVDDFAPRLSFNFTAWGRLFEEVAKFRAGRRLYARLMKERFGARNPKSMMFRTLIGGGGSGFTVQEPENNIVRGAYYALAAALSGAQTMALPTYDEAYTIPSSKAQLVALRTMQICAEETGVADTVDPLAGSYFVESLTNELERQAYEYFGRIEGLGGVVEAIKKNFFQAEIAEASFRHQREVELGERVIVGVNRFEMDDAVPAELHRVDPESERRQVARVRAMRAGRDGQAVEAALARLRAEAAGEGNLMGPIVDAARSEVTMGEMCDALREVWGVWRETPVF